MVKKKKIVLHCHWESGKNIWFLVLIHICFPILCFQSVVQLYRKWQPNLEIQRVKIKKIKIKTHPEHNTTSKIQLGRFYQYLSKNNYSHTQKSYKTKNRIIYAPEMNSRHVHLNLSKQCLILFQNTYRHCSS